MKNHLFTFLLLLIISPLSACQKEVSFDQFLQNEVVDSIKLPHVLSKQDVEPALLLRVKDNTIYLGNSAVALKSDLSRPDSYGGRGLVAALYTAFYNGRQQWTNFMSGSTTKIDDLPLVGFNKVDSAYKSNNINIITNPPLLIAADSKLTMGELIAIMSTATQASINNFRILVINRASGMPSQEELLPPGSQKNSYGTSHTTVDLAVRVLSESVEIVDSKKMLLGPTGSPTMTLSRKGTGLFDNQELENYLRDIKRQFPTTIKAHIGGLKDIDLAMISELVSCLRCNHNSSGACQKGYFQIISIWPEDYDSYILGPIAPDAAN